MVRPPGEVFATPAAPVGGTQFAVLPVAAPSMARSPSSPAFLAESYESLISTMRRPWVSSQVPATTQPTATSRRATTR